MQWQKNMQLIDANVIIRCILNDCPEMTSKAIEVIDSGAYTKPEIISEVVYVLQKVYSIQRPQIRGMVNEILDAVSCTEEKCVRMAIYMHQFLWIL